MSNKIKNILFRADSSSSIGTGHIMRDLVLAKQYKDCNIIFATQDLSGNINHKILESNFKVELLKSNDIDELNSLIKKLKIDMIVIDHYGIDYFKEKQIKKANHKVKILSFDDTYEKHYCDILLNHNISASTENYKSLVPKFCELRCGPKYTLLRDEFKNIELKERVVISSNIKIFIAIGGSDPQGYNFKIIDLLKDSKYELIIVTTSANQQLEELELKIKDFSNIELHINSRNLALLMNNSDIAIVTPSVTLNEIIFMRIPFIAIKIIENQDDMYQFLKRKKFYTLSGDNLPELVKYIRRVIDGYLIQLELIDNLFKVDNEFRL